MSSAAPSLSSPNTPDGEFINRVQGFVCDLAIYQHYFDPAAQHVPTKLTREGLLKKAAEQKKVLPENFDFDDLIAAGPRAFQVLLACRAFAKGEKHGKALMNVERLQIVLRGLPGWQDMINLDPEVEFRERVEDLVAHTREYQRLFDPKADHIPARLTVDQLKKRAAKLKSELPEKYDFDAMIRAGARTCELSTSYQLGLKGTQSTEEQTHPRNPLPEARRKVVDEFFPHWKDQYSKTEEEHFREKVDRLATRLGTYRENFDPEADIISYGITPSVLTKRAAKLGRTLPEGFKLEEMIEAGTEMADILRSCRAINAGDKRRTSGMTPAMVAYAYEKLPGIEIRAQESTISASAVNGTARNQQAHYRRTVDFAGDKLEARPRMVCAMPQRVL